MKKTGVRMAAAIVLALVLLFSCMTAYAADAKTYDYAKAYSDKQGPDWFYQYNDGSGYKDIKFYKADWMTWTAAENCKGPDGKDSYCNVYSDSASDSAKLHPDMLDGKATLAVITWKAPADGKVTIAKSTLTQNPYGNAGSDGVDAAIKHESDELFKAYVGNAKTADQPEITVDVKKGDSIHFEAGLHEKSGNDELGWPINLSFEEAAAVEEPAATETAVDNTAPDTDTAAAEENPQTGDSSMLPYIFLAAAAIAMIAILVVGRKKTVRN